LYQIFQEFRINPQQELEIIKHEYCNHERTRTTA